MSLGDKLRQRRQEMGLTRPQLAAKICVTPSAIANYENGVSYPKPDILVALMNALDQCVRGRCQLYVLRLPR